MIVTLVNLGLYQVGWFVAIVSAAGGSLGWAAAVPLGLAALHAVLAKRTLNELRFLLVAGLVGIAVDSLVEALGAVGPRGSGLLVPAATAVRSSLSLGTPRPDPSRDEQPTRRSCQPWPLR